MPIRLSSTVPIMGAATTTTPTLANTLMTPVGVGDINPVWANFGIGNDAFGVGSLNLSNAIQNSNTLDASNLIAIGNVGGQGLPIPDSNSQLFSQNGLLAQANFWINDTSALLNGLGVGGLGSSSPLAQAQAAIGSSIASVGNGSPQSALGALTGASNFTGLGMAQPTGNAGILSGITLDPRDFTNPAAINALAAQNPGLFQVGEVRGERQNVDPQTLQLLSLASQSQNPAVQQIVAMAATQLLGQQTGIGNLFAGGGVPQQFVVGGGFPGQVQMGIPPGLGGFTQAPVVRQPGTISNLPTGASASFGAATPVFNPGTISPGVVGATSVTPGGISNLPGVISPSLIGTGVMNPPPPGTMLSVFS